MLNSGEAPAEICCEAAIFYLEMGWSVIPLWGDARTERAKTPAVAWASYQQAPPDAETVRHWFLVEQFQGVGVVCGPVSGLAVLDFDDTALAQAFARLNPDLTNTLTVRSGGRGLPHYYYDVPPDVRVSTSHAPGVDLQAAGTYVVAPPTRCAGRAWEVEHDGPLRRLSVPDVQRITAFIAAHQADHARAVPADLLFVDAATGALSLEAVHRWYARLAQTHGRNTALFRAASYLRDSGWSQAQTVAALVALHTVTPPPTGHAHETPAQRQREAHATIASAYKHPAQPSTARQVTPGLLPNAVRERLLQLGQAAAARVLEGLRAAGISAGQWFTEKLACRLLHAYGIGRRAVQAALALLLPGGRLNALAEAQKTKQKTKQKPNKDNKKCFFVTGAKRVKTSYSQTQGRPPAWYIMPANGALYRALDVRPSGADALPADSLASPRMYREALHRALIARRPGRYSRRWLSARLGVSVWTSRRYDRAVGLRAWPSYLEQPLYWGNLGLLAPELAPEGPDGTFIQTADGQRYPPLQGIAVRLLGRGQRISLMRQGWNTYTLEFNHAGIQEQYGAVDVPLRERAVPPPLSQPPVNRPPVPAAPPAPERYLWLCPACMRVRLRETDPPACRCGQHPRWERYPEVQWRDTARFTLWWRARYQRFRAEQRARRGVGAQFAAPAQAAPDQSLAAQRDAWVAHLKRSPFASFFANAHQFMDAPEASEG